MRKLFVAVFGLLLVAAPAAAQDKPFDVNVGGGWTFPTADFKDDFNTGGHFGIGGTFYVKPTFGVNVEYMYHRMNGPERTITVYPTPNAAGGTAQLFQSNHQINSVTFNGVWRPHSSGMVGGYVIGGIGYYHRAIDITTPAVGYTTICDPYWLVCYPALVSTDKIVGTRSSNDFGINFGGGVTFGHNAKFYVESRYHYVWGPDFTADKANLPADYNGRTSFTANAAYFPLTFGIRF
jgi:hypothetical protein